MIAFIRGFLVVLLLAAPSLAAGYSHGQRAYRAGGYYSWNAYSCKWIWYPVAAVKGASYDNHSQTFQFTINNYQPHAARGNTAYGVLDSSYQYGPAFDSNKAFHYAAELQQLTQQTAADGYSKLTAFGYQAHQNQLELEKERTQALKLQGLAQIAESTKAQSSSSYVREQVGAAVQGGYQAVQQFQGQQQYPMLTQFCSRCHGLDKQQPDGGLYLGDHETAARSMKERFFEIVDQVSTGKMPKGQSMSGEQKAALFNEIQSIVNRYAVAPAPRYQPQFQAAPSNEPPPAPLPPQQPQPLPQPQQGT